MKTNRELVEKTKPLLKDSFVEVFACIFLASALPQIVLSFAPQNVILNIVVTCVSAYIQLGLAVYCIGLYKGDEVNYLTIFSRFNGLKPIVFILILVGRNYTWLYLAYCPWYNFSFNVFTGVLYSC